MLGGFLHIFCSLNEEILMKQGFQILRQIRSYYPQIKSMMMDKRTFNTFDKYAVNGDRNKADRLYHSRKEAELYEILKERNRKID